MVLFHGRPAPVGYINLKWAFRDRVLNFGRLPSLRFPLRPVCFNDGGHVVKLSFKSSLLK